MDWSPEPGETFLCCTHIYFATGMAPPVAGSRWFRDADRNDIQHELPGWPEGPQFTVHKKSDQNVRRAGRAAWVGIPFLLNAAIELLGGTGSPFGEPKLRGKPQEPENEIDDFPVLWAAPGTTARTLPWQLDLSRQPKGYHTEAVVTDRRMLILGTGPDSHSLPEALWSIGRDVIAGVDQMKFSEGESDVKIRFLDGSWARFGLSAYYSSKLVRYLGYPTHLISEDQLTSGQRETLAKFLARWPGYVEDRIITRRPSGNFLVEVRVPTPKTRYGYLTQSMLMGPNGESVTFQPGDM